MRCVNLQGTQKAILHYPFYFGLLNVMKNLLTQNSVCIRILHYV